MCTMMGALPTARTRLGLPQVGPFWELPSEGESLFISVSGTTFQAHIIVLQAFLSWK